MQGWILPAVNRDGVAPVRRGSNVHLLVHVPEADPSQSHQHDVLGEGRLLLEDVEEEQLCRSKLDCPGVPQVTEASADSDAFEEVDSKGDFVEEAEATSEASEVVETESGAEEAKAKSEGAEHVEATADERDTRNNGAEEVEATSDASEVAETKIEAVVDGDPSPFLVASLAKDKRCSGRSNGRPRSYGG